MWRGIFRASRDKYGHPVPGFGEIVCVTHSGKGTKSVNNGIVLKVPFAELLDSFKNNQNLFELNVIKKLNEEFNYKPRNLINLFRVLFLHQNHFWFEAERTGIVKFVYSPTDVGKIAEINNTEKENLIDLLPPWRSPRGCIDNTLDIITNKIVHEVGCAYGDTMIFMRDHVKSVSGIEYRQERVDRCLEKKLDVQKADAFTYDIPEADIYYVWMDNSEDNEKVFYRIKEKYKNKKIIIYCDGDHPSDKEALDRIQINHKVEIREFNFHEGYYHRENGKAVVGIIEI